MNNRVFGFVSLLAVIGMSIVFGMVLGGKLNAPPVAWAAPSGDSLVLAPAASQTSSFTDFADIVEQAMPAVVSVTSRQSRAETAEEDEQGPHEDLWRWFFGPEDYNRRRNRPQPRFGEGSGFIISADGYVLTNHHVVDQADDVKVGLQDGTEMEARVVGTDPSIDLALLKVDTEGDRLPMLPLGDSGALRVGEWVIAIGNPLDYQQTVTVGVVSAKNRRVPIGETDRGGLVSFIQTDAAINFGNSGGPLLDSGGNVIGINTAITRMNFAEGIGFALPINHARSAIQQLRERGFVRRGYMGISMNQGGIDRDAQEYYGLPDRRGVIVDDVTPSGPAEDAGIRKDDVIRSIDGDPVVDNDDLIARISSRQPGEKVKIGLFRQGRSFEVTTTLTERGEGLAVASRRGGAGQPPERESEGLGITVENLDPVMREQLGLDPDQRGVVVTDVEFGGMAAQKGIAPWMVITEINDNRVGDVSEWNDVVGGLRRGAPVKLNLVTPRGRSVTTFLRAP